MVAPELLDQQPSTRHCRRCDVEINAASARCPYCGARQHRREPILGWRGALVCLVAIAAAVFITRQIVESHPAPSSYSYYRSDSLTTLVPAGYQNLYLSAPHGTALAGFASGGTVGDTETVQATYPAGGSAQSRLAALVKRLRDTRGVALGYHSLVQLPGGVSIPSIYYTQGRLDYAVFVFNVCSGKVAITMTLSTTTTRDLDALSQVLPQSASAICDGPDFTLQDRADPSIPLSLPH
jgi:RNA polymerase subunit RPABC4/transcription elongation factor Spt4